MRRRGENSLSGAEESGAMAGPGHNNFNYNIIRSLCFDPTGNHLLASSTTGVIAMFEWVALSRENRAKPHHFFLFLMFCVSVYITGYSSVNYFKRKQIDRIPNKIMSKNICLFHSIPSEGPAHASLTPSLYLRRVFGGTNLILASSEQACLSANDSTIFGRNWDDVFANNRDNIWTIDIPRCTNTLRTGDPFTEG